MKKLFAKLLALIVIALPGQVSADAGTIRVGSVFVREEPGPAGKIVGSMKKGEPVEFESLPDNSKWVSVRNKRLQGVMIKSAIKSSASKPEKVRQGRAMATLQLFAPAADNATASKPTAAGGRVFEIIPEATPEELHLQGENEKLSQRVKELELRVGSMTAELDPLKEEVAKLRSRVTEKDKEITRIRLMFPYLAIIDAVEVKGEDVMITGVGQARMVNEGEKVILRLEGPANIAKGDKAMQRVARERYMTGGNGNQRAYYVVNSKSIKSS